MGDIALRVEALGKQYYIGSGRQKAHTTLRDTLTEVIGSSLRRAGKFLSGRDIRAADRGETIWALKDVSFEINRGEVVGIIGYNGAGKSTLLKILSRITEPTEGYADIYGRVGSLLEVGTGFHPELTGRENIYLNGAILGMKRVEIQRKFDEIVAFAELEKFIDTPVKHYSSGMYMRLAFAVAAHLEPEVLLVDEVLAVGDVGQQGRTVLFVSHNMSAINRLCSRAILLDGGRVLQDGPSHRVVNTYLSSEVGTMAVREWPDPAKAPSGAVVRLRCVRVRTEGGQTTDVVDIRQPVGIDMEYDVLQSGYVLMPYVHFFNQEGVLAFEASDHDPTWRRRPRPAGRWVSTAWIPGNLLAEGTLFVWPCLFTLEPEVLEISVRDAVAFQVKYSMEGD